MDDRELLARFEAATIPAADWTHRAHVRVALLHLREHPFDEALRRVRRGIRALNAANGVVEGPERGYHETVTQAFLRLVRATDRAWAERVPAATSDAFCDGHPQLMTRLVLRLFYTPARILSAEARATFVEPDLAALPAP